MNYKFTEHAKSLLKNYYMREDEINPKESFYRAAHAYTKSNPALGKRIYQYACKGWFMFSSPILSNAARTGLPISCFLTYVPDTI